MPHKGKIGPYAFRRDLSLNFFDYHRQQWFESYKVNFGPLPPGEGQPLQNHTLRTKKTEYIGVQTLFWQSPFTQFGLFFYKVELRAILRDAFTYQKEGSVFVSGHGLIWHWIESTVQGSQYPQFDSAKITDFWSLDWFNGQPSLRDDAIPGLKWTEQPPPN